MNRLSTFANRVLNKVTPNPRIRGSALDFQDASNPSGFNFHPYQRMKDDIPSHPTAVYPKPLNLQSNKTERNRLQGIMQRSNADPIVCKSSEQRGNRANRFKRLLFIESARRAFFAVWVLSHALVFGLGMVHYSLKGACSCTYTMSPLHRACLPFACLSC